MRNHNQTGWAADRVETEGFASTLPALYGEQLDELPFHRDRSAFPFRFLARALKGSKNVTAGRLVSFNQGSVGSCVGCMGSRVADLTAACDIYQRREPERWPTNSNGRALVSSPEYCYAAARQVVGNLGRWDGATGSGMARAFKEIGVAYQKPYGLDLDLSRYSSTRARDWARRGVPEPVLMSAKEHPFRATVRVTSTEHAVALLQNGYGVGICSGLGWNTRRDVDGFCRRVRAGWAHAMAVVGYLVTASGRRGLVVQNSWGPDWVSGPRPALCPDLPDGGFVCDWRDFENVVSSGDCWAYGGFKGFEVSPFDWSQGGLGW